MTKYDKLKLQYNLSPEYVSAYNSSYLVNELKNLQPKYNIEDVANELQKYADSNRFEKDSRNFKMQSTSKDFASEFIYQSETAKDLYAETKKYYFENKEQIDNEFKTTDFDKCKVNNLYLGYILHRWFNFWSSQIQEAILFTKKGCLLEYGARYGDVNVPCETTDKKYGRLAYYWSKDANGNFVKGRSKANKKIDGYIYEIPFDVKASRYPNTPNLKNKDSVFYNLTLNQYLEKNSIPLGSYIGRLETAKFLIENASDDADGSNRSHVANRLFFIFDNERDKFNYLKINKAVDEFLAEVQKRGFRSADVLINGKKERILTDCIYIK
jgi:hypothetical protein